MTAEDLGSGVRRAAQDGATRLLRAWPVVVVLLTFVSTYSVVRENVKDLKELATSRNAEIRMLNEKLNALENRCTRLEARLEWMQ